MNPFIFYRPLFGFWLPFIGWKTLPCGEDREPAVPLFYDDPVEHVADRKIVSEKTFFILAWAGQAFVFSWELVAEDKSGDDDKDN